LNEAYVGDITYISTREGWLYLSVFIDLCSRTVVGWSMNKRMTATLVTDSLQMAIKGRKPKSGLLIHSDQGSQYASAQYQQLLSDNSFICSMSRRGNCWDTQFMILMTSHRSDPCWDWLLCLRVDLSTGVGVPECYRAQRL